MMKGKTRGLFAALFALVLAMAIGPAAAFAAPGAPAGANALKGGVVAQADDDGDDGDGEGDDDYYGAFYFEYDGLECDDDDDDDYFYTGKPVSVIVCDDNYDPVDKAALQELGLELRISKEVRTGFDAEKESWSWRWDYPESIDGAGHYQVGLYQTDPDGDWNDTVEEIDVYDTYSLTSACVFLDGEQAYDDEINEAALGEPLDVEVYAWKPSYDDEEDDEDEDPLTEGKDYEVAIKDATGEVVKQEDLKKGIVYFLHIVPAENSDYTGEAVVPIRFYGDKDLSYGSLLLEGDELDSDETFPLSEATGITASKIQVVCGDEYVNSKYYTLKLATGELVTDEDDDEYYDYDLEAAVDFTGFQNIGHYLLFAELTEEGEAADYEQSGEALGCEIAVLNDNDLSLYEFGFVNGEGEIEDYDDVTLIEGMTLPMIALFRDGGSDDDEPIVFDSELYTTTLYYMDEEGYDEPANALTTEPLKVGEYKIVFTTKDGQSTLEEEFSVYSAYDLDAAGEVTPDDVAITEGDSLPEFVVTAGGKTLAEGEDKDYTVSYKQYIYDDDEDYGVWVTWEGDGQPKEPGEYRFVAEGVDPYYGSCFADFRILAENSLELASIEVKVGDKVTTIGEGEGEFAIVKCAYTGQPINPTYTLSVNGDIIPAESLNIEMEYTREGLYYESEWTPVDTIKERGWYVAWITAEGYADETWVDFYVYSDVPEEAVSIEEGPFAYEGVPVEPTVTVTFDGAPLVEDEDYEVEYANNNEDGATGTVRVYGIGGYEFDVTKTFVIGNAAVDDDQAAADEVAGLIGELPETVANDEAKTQVDEAKAAFDALTEAQKALVSEDAKNKLDAAVGAATQYVADKAAADEVAGLIEKLPEAVASDEAKAQVDEAAAAFDALTEAQKALVSADGKAKLDTAVDAVAQYIVEKIEALIELLPETVANDADNANVEAAVTAYSALTDAQKALIREALQAKLKAAEKSAQQYAAAQEKKNQQVKANPMTVKAKAVKAKAKKLKKKAMKVAPAKAFNVGNPQGAVTYKLLKVKAKKKLQKQAKKKIKVASDGTIKLGKKLKKGTYKLTVQVSATGNTNYKPVTKTVTVKVKVK